MFAVSLGDPTPGNSRGSQSTPAVMVGSQPDGSLHFLLFRCKPTQIPKVYNIEYPPSPSCLKGG